MDSFILNNHANEFTRIFLPAFWGFGLSNPVLTEAVSEKTQAPDEDLN